MRFLAGETPESGVEAWSGPWTVHSIEVAEEPVVDDCYVEIGKAWLVVQFVDGMVTAECGHWNRDEAFAMAKEMTDKTVRKAS